MEKPSARATDPAASRANPRTSSVLVALWLLTGAAYGSVLPFLTVYAARRGLTLTEIGLLGAVSAGASAALQPLMGRLVDRTGRRKLVLVSATIVGALGFGGLGFAVPAPVIFLCATLGTAGFYGARVVIVAATVQAVEGVASRYARYRICPSFGYTVTAVGGGFLLTRLPFAVLFCIGASLYLLAGFCGALLPAPHPAGAQPAGTVAAVPATISPRRVLLTLTLMSLLYYLASSSGDAYVPLLMRHLRGSLTDVGIASTISAVVEIPLMIVVGSLSDRTGRAALLAAGVALVPLRFALYFFVNTPLQLMGVQVLDGFTFSTYAIAGIALLSDQTPGDERAQAFSTYSAGGTIGTILGPLVAGLLAAPLGLQPMFGLIALGSVAVPATVVYGLWPLLVRVPRAGSAHGAVDALARAPADD